MLSAASRESRNTMATATEKQQQQQQYDAACQYEEQDFYDDWEDTSEFDSSFSSFESEEETAGDRVENVIASNIQQTFKHSYSFTIYSEYVFPSPPPTPKIIPATPASIPLPSIDTLLEYPEMPFSVYDALRYGGDRIVQDPVQPQVSYQCEQHTPVNKFGFREFETIEEEDESEGSEEDVA